MDGEDGQTDGLAAVEACEQRLVNLWPAVDTLLIGKWAVRFAHGYSGRANSASALWRGALLSDDEIGLIAQLYREAGLPPAIRLTPLAEAGLKTRLSGMGWAMRTHSSGMIADASRDWRGDPRICFEPAPGEAWLAGVSALQEASKSNPAHLKAIVGRIRLPVGFATAQVAGEARGFGMVGIDRGWAEIGSIILAPEARGQGLGRALVLSMLNYAVGHGASRVFLQVEASNAVAISLYRSLGFRPLYEYREYRLPG
jgi:ribosomal protein S18 acetylase RimI-like enzyme